MLTVTSTQRSCQVSELEELCQKKFPKQMNHNCKICLQEMKDFERKEFCDCKGSNSYVHQSCLLQWITKSRMKEQDQVQEVCFCQVCKGKINLKIQSNRRCLNMDEIKKELFDEKFWYTLATLITMLGSILFMVGIIQISKIQVLHLDSKIKLISIIICVILFFSALMIFVLKCLIKQDQKIVGIWAKNIKIARINPPNYRIYDINMEKQIDLTTNIILT